MMTTIETKPEQHPVCECGCCGPAGATAVMEPPKAEAKQAAAATDATFKCDCGCSDAPEASGGSGCECGCTDSGCECGCGGAQT